MSKESFQWVLGLTAVLILAPVSIIQTMIKFIKFKYSNCGKCSPLITIRCAVSEKPRDARVARFVSDS